MDLLWPGVLFSLILIPLLIGTYIWILRRRKPVAVRYSSLSLIRDALPKQNRWLRHVPFALFMLALTSLIVAISRPVAVVTVPTGQTSIIMTIDVSRSMLQDDILPTRIEAAQQAAVGFIRNQKASTQIGIVAFAGFAELIQAPTNDQEALEAAVESLTTGRRTAIGSGILKAIDTVAEIDSSVAPSVTAENGGVPPVPVAKGAYVPDIIVVLTDGVSNAGIDPLEAAQQAADRGIRVYTIGYGTANGSPGVDFFGGGGGNGGVSPFGGGGGGNGFFGGGGGQGFGGFQRGIDEETLKKVAALTGGEYYAASSAAELQSVFENLPTYLIVKHETLEISVAFALAGALAAILAILLALRWQPLP